MMKNTEKGQINKSAAEIYDEFFLPALFQQWTNRLTESARIEKGDRVIDVACGTGALALAAFEKAGENGAVTGVDINDGMLAVAERKNADIEWRNAPAENLPFENYSFDRVVSQFGLMFFEDRVQSLKEMKRVLKSGGVLAVAVWDALETSPGYAEMTELLRHLFGERIASALETPFVLGDREVLKKLFAEAGMENVEIKTETGTARFPSIESWVHTDIRGWTLADEIDEQMYRQLLFEAQKTLVKFTGKEGKVAFDAPAHIAAWRKTE